jgi:hypothetical protein
MFSQKEDEVIPQGEEGRSLTSTLHKNTFKDDIQSQHSTETWGLYRIKKHEHMRQLSITGPLTEYSKLTPILKLIN